MNTYSGNAIISDTPDGFRVYTHHLRNEYVELAESEVTINSKGAVISDIAAGNAYLADVNINLASIALPGFICDAGVSALLAIEPYKTWQTLIATAKAAGKIGNIDTSVASDACQDRAKAMGLIGQVVPGPAGIAFDAISKLGDCCPKFYEKLVNG